MLSSTDVKVQQRPEGSGSSSIMSSISMHFAFDKKQEWLGTVVSGHVWSRVQTHTMKPLLWRFALYGGWGSVAYASCLRSAPVPGGRQEKKFLVPGIFFRGVPPEGEGGAKKNFPRKFFRAPKTEIS